MTVRFVDDIIISMEYVEADGQIIIRGGFENRGIIEVPGQAEGLAVTEIDSYAFAHRLELTEVILPPSIRRIGAHAFYNCKNLRLVELYDGIRELEDGAFKNCHSLFEIKMHCREGREGCIRNLLDENIQELSLDIEYGRGERARLFFPSFEDDYVENTPARIFRAVSYGSGGAYRQCMQAGSLDYRAYDGLFARSVREDRFEAALFNCMGRLACPYRLSASAREAYTSFLKENGGRAAACFIARRDTEALSFLCGFDALGENEVGEALEAAAGTGNPQLIGILLDYKSRNFKTKRKSFDL
ncbi:MAG: leucine-rich repeat domain-containing protein [Butyrivibrio sp.]|nr:leucine-rich repeat domain-containing protein [Butyrivibrio sp.]